jgi:hypothetical protein
MLHRHSNDEKENKIAELVRNLRRKRQDKIRWHSLKYLLPDQYECNFNSTLYRYVTNYFLTPSKACQLQTLRNGSPEDRLKERGKLERREIYIEWSFNILTFELLLLIY